MPLLHLFGNGSVHATSTPSSSATTESAILEQVTWSEKRPLAWADFKGQPDDANPHHALTAANLAVDASCKNNQFSYDVKCVFLPHASWTKNNASDILLAHEQLHFDLTEVHARMLRKDLKQLDCSGVKADLKPLVSRAFQDWKAEQRKFDEDCQHGLDKEKQQEWSAAISKRLIQLQAYRIEK
ncbi:DUF922 domain-containing protein [Pontibacter mangrovi]|nr:DUF922 domain-containing protein [Pontibacter mangrovi]